MAWKMVILTKINDGIILLIPTFYDSTFNEGNKTLSPKQITLYYKFTKQI